jgi:hypothetical protein
MRAAGQGARRDEGAADARWFAKLDESRSNSLFRRVNSLFGRSQFPVPGNREFGRNALE